jgi:hypothetical protein
VAPGGRSVRQEYGLAGRPGTCEAVPEVDGPEAVGRWGCSRTNTVAAGTILSDGGYYDASAGGWVAKDAASVGLEMNGVLGGFILYANTGLTPGNSFSPSYVIDWLGAGSHLNFTPRVEALAGAIITGGTNPTTGNGMMLYGGSTGQIIQKDWSTGTLGQINIAGNTVNLQVGPTTGITSTFTFGSAGQITHLHSAQAAAAETLYTATISDDATAKFQIKNSSSTNSKFIPNLLTMGSSTSQSRVETISITTDTGTTPCWEWYFDVGGSNVATRPLWTINSIGGTLLSLIPLGTGNNAALVFPASGSGLPAVTTRNAGTKIVLFNAISGTQVDYGIGVGTGTTGVWFSNAQQPSAGESFAWYAKTTEIGRLLATSTSARFTIGVPGTPAGNLHIYDTAPSIIVESSGTTAIKLVVNGASTYFGSDNATPLSIRTNGVNLITLDSGGNKVSFGGGIIQKNRVALTSPVTVAVTDWFVSSNLTVAGAVAVNLPPGAVGQEFVIKDGKGDAGANTITVTPNGGDTIDGAASKTITTNYGVMRLLYLASGWVTI